MDNEMIQTLLNLLDVKDQEIRELKDQVEYFKGLYISLQGEILMMDDPTRNPGLMTEYEMEIQRLMQQNYELIWGPSGELPPIQGEYLPYQEIQNGNNQTPPWLAYQEIQNNDSQAPPPIEEEESKLPTETNKEELQPSPSKTSNKRKGKLNKWLTEKASSSGIKK